jgi:Sec-independent protein translocase protein TatA
MSGIGFWELIILFLIGLIVLGPERLPRVAGQLGSRVSPVNSAAGWARPGV